MVFTVEADSYGLLRASQGRHITFWAAEDGPVEVVEFAWEEGLVPAGSIWLEDGTRWDAEKKFCLAWSEDSATVKIEQSAWYQRPNGDLRPASCSTRMSSER